MAVVADSFTEGRRRPFAYWSTRAASIAAIAWLAAVVIPAEEFASHRVYVALVYALASILVYAATRRPVSAAGLAALLFIAVHELSVLKLEHLNAPMVAGDVLLLFQPEISRLLLEAYPHLALPFAAGIALIAVYAVFSLRTEQVWPAPRNDASRSAPAVAVILAVGGLAVVVPGPGPLAVVMRDVTDAHYAYGGESLVSRYIVSFIDTGLHRPAMPPTRTVWPEAATPASAGAPRRPDIVAVLEETTFDPRTVLPGCTQALCGVPMFGGMDNTAAAGPLRVHVKGGLTWLSEFAFLTGSPHSLYGQAGHFAQARVLPHFRYTLPRWLKTLGYRTVVVYPLRRHAFFGARSYGVYGFDEVREHPLIASGARAGFWDLSDRELFDEVRAVIAAEDVKPQRAPLFIYVLTLQQHGPHGGGLKGQPPRDETIRMPRLSVGANAMLNDYLTRLRWSDEALRGLDASLRARGLPYVLAHFGDHQPTFYAEDLPLRSPVPGVAPEFLTYYAIQTGGLGDGYRPRRYPSLDIAHLGALVLDVAGLPKDPYFAAGSRLRETCDGFFLECRDRDAFAAYHGHMFDRLQAVAFEDEPAPREMAR